MKLEKMKQGEALAVQGGGIGIVVGPIAKALGKGIVSVAKKQGKEIVKGASLAAFGAAVARGFDDVFEFFGFGKR